jgi:uncharacterized membrane protein
MTARLAIPIIWGMNTAVLFRLWNVWDRLPQRVAVHFGMSLQPNGWSSKNGMLITVLAVMLGQALLASWLILRLGDAVALIAPVQVLVSVTLFGAFWQMISYNADGKPFQPLWLIVPMIMLFATITIFMVSLLFRFYRR